MIIRVKKNQYQLDTSFMTLFRYRASYGVSFFTEDRSGEMGVLKPLIRLIYTAIQGQKPEFAEFFRDALSDESFLFAAKTFQDELCRDDKSARRTGADNEMFPDPDEFYIIATWAKCGLPASLLDELSYHQAIGLVNICCEISSAHERPKAMTEADYSNTYNLTPEVDRRVAAYLAKVGGVE